MNGIQIENSIRIIPNLVYKFKGLFLNDFIPRELYYLKEGFIVVNTLTSPSEKIGYWLIFYKINSC